jgi:disulfide bond formation protein DsbB
MIYACLYALIGIAGIILAIKQRIKGSTHMNLSPSKVSLISVWVIGALVGIFMEFHLQTSQIMPISVMVACLFILLFQIDAKLDRTQKDQDELLEEIQNLKSEIHKLTSVK